MAKSLNNKKVLVLKRAAKERKKLLFKEIPAQQHHLLLVKKKKNCSAQRYRTSLKADAGREKRRASKKSAAFHVGKGKKFWGTRFKKAADIFQGKAGP